MILDLREFVDFPAKAHLEADPGELVVERDDVLDVKKAAVDLSIQKSGEEYFCQGVVTGSIEIECARCLEPYTAEVSGKTDFIVRSAIRDDSRDKDVVDNEQYIFLEGDDVRADITESVRQTLALTVPLKPVCDKECRGLCAQCGANLNLAPCSCDQEKTDSRWDGLKGLARE